MRPRRHVLHPHACQGPTAETQKARSYVSPELQPTPRWALAPESWPCPGGSQGPPGGGGGRGGRGRSLGSELTSRGARTTVAWFTEQPSDSWHSYT